MKALATLVGLVIGTCCLAFATAYYLGAKGALITLIAGLTAACTELARQISQ